jgi:spore germination protein KC
MFKKRMICFLLLLMLCTTSGCLNSAKSPINTKENVVIQGIDKESDMVKLTSMVPLVQPIGSEGSTNNKGAIYTAYGESVFDAIRNLHAYTDKIIFWGYLDFIIIGEETAREGIGPYLDIMIRDHEIKQNCKLAIVQESTASQFLKTTDSEHALVNDILKSLFSDTGALSQSSEITLLDYMQMMNCDRGCLRIPCIQTVDFIESSNTFIPKVDGYALFDEDKLVGFVNGKMSRALNLIINEVESGVIVVTDPDDTKVTLEIISSNSKIDVDYTQDFPSALIKLSLTSNISEYWGTTDIFHEEIIEYLEREQERIIKNELEEVVTYLQSKKADAIGTTDTIYHKYPVKTDGFEKEDWQNIFGEMTIDVEVTSNINRVYNIKKPSGYESEDE